MQKHLAELPPPSARRLQTYVDEAFFFAEVLAEDLQQLPANANVVEVGSGIGLLSLLLGERGLTVSSYEPESSGFSEMTLLRDVVLDSWKGDKGRVSWYDQPIPRNSDAALAQSRYAVAINVIEHVPEWKVLVRDTLTHLVPGAGFRVICPNSAYPYETHFEIPTLFGKQLTQRVMRRRIAASTITDPTDFWADLSWPTGRKIDRAARELGVHVQFRSASTLAYLRRAETDAGFRDRKGRLPLLAASAAKSVGPAVVSALPPSSLPVLDCTFRTSVNPGVVTTSGA